MNLENIIPASYIVIEPEINNLAMKKFFDDNRIKPVVKDDANKASTSLNRAIDTTASLFGDTEKTTGETAKSVLLNNANFLNHFNYGVVLNNVSQSLLRAIQIMQLRSIHITQEVETSSLKFWLPQEFQTTSRRKEVFSEAVVAFQELRQRLMNEYSITNPEALDVLMPDLFAKNALVTGGIGDWMNLIIMMTAFNNASENRFVFINLFLKFVEKSPQLFAAFRLLDAQGMVYGVDTLKTNMESWSKYRVDISL